MIYPFLFQLAPHLIKPLAADVFCRLRGGRLVLISNLLERVRFEPWTFHTVAIGAETDAGAYGLSLTVLVGRSTGFNPIIYFINFEFPLSAHFMCRHIFVLNPFENCLSAYTEIFT